MSCSSRRSACRLRDHVGERRAVLLLQTLEQREAILDLLQPRRRRVDAPRVGAQEEREILELRLDASRASRYGANCASSAASSPTLLPDRCRAPAAPPRLPRRARRRRRRTGAAAGRRWRAPGASPSAPRLRPASARPCRSPRAGTPGTRRATPSRAHPRRRRARSSRTCCHAREGRRTPARARRAAPANSSSRSRCAAGSSRT